VGGWGGGTWMSLSCSKGSVTLVLACAPADGSAWCGATRRPLGLDRAVSAVL
jgi:hypothetical protein